MTTVHDMKKIALIMTVGLCEAIERNAIPIHEAQHYLFSPGTMNVFENDPELREIIDEFVVRFDEQLTALRSAWRRDDLSRIAEIAHWIKGSAGTVGFGAFTEPAAALETAAELAQRDVVENRISQLEALFRRIPTPIADRIS